MTDTSWNTCPSCEDLVDIEDEISDGGEVSCYCGWVGCAATFQNQAGDVTWSLVAYDDGDGDDGFHDD